MGQRQGTASGATGRNRADGSADVTALALCDCRAQEGILISGVEIVNVQSQVKSKQNPVKNTHLTRCRLSGS